MPEGEEGDRTFATQAGPRNSFVCTLGREGAIAKEEGVES